MVLYFMHARYSPKRTQLVIICAVFWLAIMLALTLSDYTTREREAAAKPRTRAQFIWNRARAGTNLLLVQSLRY